VGCLDMGWRDRWGIFGGCGNREVILLCVGLTREDTR